MTWPCRGGGWAAALALFCPLLAAPALADAPRRWALVVGENRGLVGEEPLRYADADAHRVADALTQLGGIPAENTVVLATADAADVRAALQGLSARLSASGERQERLVVFVSSHAGDGALHLRGTSLPLPELVEFLKAAPVEVGVLVVDACRSGAVTRLKGLAPASDKPRVEAAALEGRVLISASGADEYAQESEELSGSYFTHHLVTGLRGAADASRDGRVTLDEAYRWAWARTVEATFASRGGVQRPAFKVDLRGQGELVLTEPGTAPARLTLAVQAAGRWLVVAAASGAVVAELEKPEGPATLALAPGAYRVRLRTERGFLERQVDVPAAGGVTLRGDDLERASLVRVALKGRDTPLYVLSASGTVASPLASTLGAQPGIDLRLRFDQTWFAGVNQLSLAVLARDAPSAAVGFRQTEIELRGGAGFRLDWARLSVLFGVDLGALLVLQSSLPDGTSRTSLGALALAVVEGRVHLVGPLDAVVTLAGGGALLPKRLGPAVLPRASGSAGLALSF